MCGLVHGLGGRALTSMAPSGCRQIRALLTSGAKVNVGSVSAERELLHRSCSKITTGSAMLAPRGFAVGVLTCTALRSSLMFTDSVVLTIAFAEVASIRPKNRLAQTFRGPAPRGMCACEPCMGSPRCVCIIRRYAF